MVGSDDLWSRMVLCLFLVSSRSEDHADTSAAKPRKSSTTKKKDSGDREKEKEKEKDKEDLGVWVQTQDMVGFVI